MRFLLLLLTISLINCAEVENQDSEDNELFAKVQEAFSKINPDDASPELKEIVEKVAKEDKYDAF